MYVFRTTEHYREAGREVMGRSVLTRAVNGDPTDLVCLYDLSVVRSGGTFVNVSCVVVDGGLPGLPFRGPALLAWGSGRYRASDAYLAAVPLGSVEDRGRLAVLLPAPTAPGGRTGASTSATPSRCSRIRRSASSRSPGTRRWACG